MEDRTPRDVRGAAARIGLSISSLNKLRVSGEGPTFMKLGHRVLYDPRDLEAWLESRKRRSTSDER
jgi:hypothetical protein